MTKYPNLTQTTVIKKIKTIYFTHINNKKLKMNLPSAKIFTYECINKEPQQGVSCELKSHNKKKHEKRRWHMSEPKLEACYNDYESARI